jgi:3-oxoacyl-[acyl-carrier protein] reductase
VNLGLRDKVVFVAGASRGIGLGIVESLLAEGARVAMTARNADPLEESRHRLAAIHGEDRLFTFAGDMTDSGTIEEAVELTERKLGPLYGAVANIGRDSSPSGFDLDDQTWEAGFRQNFDSAFRLARSALRRMTPRREGALLMISSTAAIGAFGALGIPLTYGVAKAAMNHLTRELARMAGPSDVRVNAIIPGNVIFPGGVWDQHMNGPRADFWRSWTEREVPMRRFGRPDEIGMAAAFLLSPYASFITGALVPVDGGRSVALG